MKIDSSGDTEMIFSGWVVHIYTSYLRFSMRVNLQYLKKVFSGALKKHQKIIAHPTWTSNVFFRSVVKSHKR